MGVGGLSRVQSITCLSVPATERTGSHTGYSQSWPAVGPGRQWVSAHHRTVALTYGHDTAATAPAPGWGHGHVGEAGYSAGPDVPTCTNATAYLPARLGTPLLSPVSWGATLLVMQAQVAPCLQQVQHHQATA